MSVRALTRHLLIWTICLFIIRHLTSSFAAIVRPLEGAAATTVGSDKEQHKQAALRRAPRYSEKRSSTTEFNKLFIIHTFIVRVRSTVA